VLRLQRARVLPVTGRILAMAMVAVVWAAGLTSCGHGHAASSPSQGEATKKVQARQLLLLTLSFSSPCRTDAAPVRLPFPMEGGPGRVAVDLRCQAVPLHHDLGLILRPLGPGRWHAGVSDANGLGKGEADLTVGVPTQVTLGDSTVELKVEVVDIASE
jgi:hypothetical protein